MWEAGTVILHAGQIRKFHILEHGERLRYLDDMGLWRSDKAFANHGHDATLIAPCPRVSLSAYPHLAAFIREAPERQRHALWQGVGKALERRLDGRPLWLSTAGLGVYWLHLRLDSHPKYYSFQAYRKPPVALLDP